MGTLFHRVDKILSIFVGCSLTPGTEGSLDMRVVISYTITFFPFKAPRGLLVHDGKRSWWPSYISWGPVHRAPLSYRKGIRSTVKAQSTGSLSIRHKDIRTLRSIGQSKPGSRGSLFIRVLYQITSKPSSQVLDVSIVPFIIGSLWQQPMSIWVHIRIQA